MRLSQKVKKNIENIREFKRGNTVIVGVSGGPDSTALVHILHNLQYQLGFHLHIAHYNHHLRKGAHGDQKFVEKLSQQLNIPCSVGHWKHSKTFKKGSLEDISRQHRFQFFIHLAEKIKAHAIILAHTEDDLAETVLMRILRGTGLQGLRGILPQRKMGGINFTRPLLNIKKKDILTFLSNRNISYRIDPTNKDTKFFRNKIRLKLLPLLTKQYNSNLTEILNNLADNANTDYGYLEVQTQKLFSKLALQTTNKKGVRFNLKQFSKQHPALKRMLIRRGIEHLKGDTNRITLTHFREIDDLLNNRPKKTIIHLPQNIRARKDSQYLTLTHN